MSHNHPDEAVCERLRRETSGAMLAEYALMLALFGMACACALYYFSHAIFKAFADAADLISVISRG